MRKLTHRQIGEWSRFAWKLVIEEVKERGIQPDRNLLRTARLRENLMPPEMTQLL